MSAESVRVSTWPSWKMLFAARRRLDLYGQATLRFFAVCQLADPDAETLKHELYEDNEQELMLASCTHFELRSGSQAGSDSARLSNVG